jgi:hypothetical protein
MIRIQVRYGKKTADWFLRFGIKRTKLQVAFNKLLEKEFPGKDIKRAINIKVDTRYLDSGYYFGSNTLDIGVAPFRKKYDKKSRRRIFLRDLLHEFRHWIQDKLLRVKERELDYTAEDVNNKTDKYYWNVWEVDARQYSSKNFQCAFRVLFNK